MEENFVKETKIIDKTDEEKENEILLSILKVRKDLEIAINNFEFAEDDLIDYYAYQIKANQSKLDYLLKVAKHKGIILEMKNEIRLKCIINNEAV